MNLAILLPNTVICWLICLNAINTYYPWKTLGHLPQYADAWYHLPLMTWIQIQWKQAQWCLHCPLYTRLLLWKQPSRAAYATANLPHTHNSFTVEPHCLSAGYRYWTSLLLGQRQYQSPWLLCHTSHRWKKIPIVLAYKKGQRNPVWGCPARISVWSLSWGRLAERLHLASGFLVQPSCA